MAGRTDDVRVRDVLRLAIPALGALAAEPLYLIVDTALVGHLGGEPLAGLALGGTVLTALLAAAAFLEYGSTGAIARARGGGDARGALAIAVQTTLLAVAVGAALTAAAELGAEPLVGLLGGDDSGVHAQAVTWLRIAALGAPFVCATLAGQAWLRGFEDTLTPFVVVVAGNVASAVLSGLLVYPAGLGLRGSAIANAAAQAASAAVFAALLRRRGATFGLDGRVLRSQLATARDLSARTVAFVVSFGLATAVAAHLGGAVVAAHQVCLQLWSFLSYSLDSLAIAAQALVGTRVGAGDVGAARVLSWRLVRWSAWLGVGIAAVLLAGWTVIPRLFVSDEAVLDSARQAWPLLAGMQPIAGVVFALDGVLIGAGDTAFLARATLVAGLGAYVPIALLSGAFGLGLRGIWVGLTGFVAVRCVASVARLRGQRWWRASSVPAGMRSPPTAGPIP